jgi:phosphate transport system permease protein
MQATLTPQTVAAALRSDPNRNRIETIISWIMMACAIFCIFVTIGIVFILLNSGREFFTHEFFVNAYYAGEAVKQVAQEKGLNAGELLAQFGSLLDDRPQTFNKIAEAMPGTTSEELQAVFTQLKETATGFPLWGVFKTSMARFFLDFRWTPLFGIKRFGVWPLINGTLMVTAVAMLMSVPLGLLTAIYLGLYAPRKVATYMRPVVEILAGIPTVVYGYFALLYITPVFQILIPNMPIFNILSAGIMLGVMIIPTVSSISLDAINAVPRALQEGAYGLGATKMEVVLKVVFPAAISGILASIILGISRAVGETMIVTIAAGQQPVSYTGQNFWENLAIVFNPAQSMATMTAYIAQVSLGDAPAGSIAHVTLYIVGLSLFFMTLFMNLLSMYISKRFREAYE